MQTCYVQESFLAIAGCPRKSISMLKIIVSKLKITSYFLFDAALVTVLGIIWCRRKVPYSSSDISNRQWLKRLEGAMDVAIEVLGFCGASSKTASWNWTLLVQLKQWLKITAPQDLEPSDETNYM